MMFKTSFFLTLALALSSLNAITAVSVPRQEEDGGSGAGGSGGVLISFASLTPNPT